MGMVVSCFSNIMYFSEKICLWIACVGLISCIVITFVVTLGMGIGLGYNYCFVDLKTRYKYVPERYLYPGSPRYPYRARNEEQMSDRTQEDVLAPPTKYATYDDMDFNKLKALIANETDMASYDNSLASNGTDLASDDSRLASNYTRLTSNDTGLVSNDTDLASNDTNLVSDDTLLASNDTALASDDTLLASNETSPIPDMDSSKDFSTDLSAATSDELTTFNVNTRRTLIFSRVDSRTRGQFVDAEDSKEAFLDPIVYNNDPTNRDLTRRIKKLVMPIRGSELISLLSKNRLKTKTIPSRL